MSHCIISSDRSSSNLPVCFTPTTSACRPRAGWHSIPQNERFTHQGVLCDTDAHVLMHYVDWLCACVPSLCISGVPMESSTLCMPTPPPRDGTILSFNAEGSTIKAFSVARSPCRPHRRVTCTVCVCTAAVAAVLVHSMHCMMQSALLSLWPPHLCTRLCFPLQGGILLLSMDKPYIHALSS